MINIYTSREILSNRIILDEVEDFFNAKVSQKQFEEYDETVIWNIDKAKVIDYETGEIKTPFGLTDINKLSGGCKTVLDYLYMKRHSAKYESYVLNVTGCGYNALENLFMQMDRLNDSSTALLLLHTDGLMNCSKREYLINNRYVITELSDIIGRNRG